MKLHENPSLFREAITITAQHIDISEVHIEKDYWVTLALYTLFKSSIADEAVFKGGTALSKCFGLIERFSEDIDLVVLNDKGETGNQLKTKLKKVTEVIAEKIEEKDFEGITNKKGMIRKIAYNYPKIVGGGFGQVRDIIVLEASWLGRSEPYHRQKISSYIYEMMKDRNQEDLAKEYEMLPFDVQVLDVKRTICEKIMSLVRFSYGDNAIENLQKKVRHTYDIHQLLKEEDIKSFFLSDEFETILQTVGQDDLLSFRSENDWLQNHPKNALIFNDLETVWNKIKGAYTGEFSDLVYGDLPDETQVKQTLKLVKERLNAIHWDLKVKN